MRRGPATCSGARPAVPELPVARMTLRTGLPVARKTARDLRWHVVGYGVGLAAVAALVVAIYPSYADTIMDLELPSIYESFFGEGASDLSRPRAFLQVEFFAWAPLLLAVFAIISGTALLGGEEGAGTLELLLAQPISRRAVFAQKLAALALAAVAIHLVAGLGFLLTAPFVDLRGEVGALELFAATFSVLPFVLTCAALSVLAAALTPTRGLAAGLMTVETVVIYLMNVFADLVPGLDWMRYLSPFFYSDAQRVLTQGVVWWHQGLLLASGLVIAGLALLAFERREIGTGRSPLADGRSAGLASAIRSWIRRLVPSVATPRAG